MSVAVVALSTVAIISAVVAFALFMSVSDIAWTDGPDAQGLSNIKRAAAALALVSAWAVLAALMTATLASALAALALSAFLALPFGLCFYGLATAR
jgi:hypothetical protein